jgi:hypothetical protein
MIGFAAAGHFLGLANRATYFFNAKTIGVVKFLAIFTGPIRRLIDDFPAGRRLLSLLEL